MSTYHIRKSDAADAAYTVIANHWCNLAYDAANARWWALLAQGWQPVAADSPLLEAWAVTALREEGVRVTGTSVRDTIRLARGHAPTLTSAYDAGEVLAPSVLADATLMTWVRQEFSEHCEQPAYTAAID